MKRLINSLAFSIKLVFCLFFMAGFLFCKNALALTYEMPSIFFKEETPSVNGRVEESLSVYDRPLEVLKADALAIQKLKGHFDIKIVGYTDSSECVGAECTHLSLRRAQLIYDWMLTHGVLASQLLPPEGHGNADPTGDNNTPVGRAGNRRVEFQWIPISPSS
jgi:OOP family OmpA-OmpF porin